MRKVLLKMLRARNLHKSYIIGRKKLEVIKGIDIAVDAAEVVVILGPSGAGKSTLLHMLAGLDMPDKGAVAVDGADIYKSSEETCAHIRNEKIGIVFQFYHLLPDFTVLENVMMPGLISRILKRNLLKKRAEKLLREIGLGDRISHRAGELSGGEAQRAAIARALVNEPRIIFCDEPTGNLDSKNSDAICELIWQLNKRHRKSFVIVTHHQKIAERADRVLRIKDGKIE